MHLWLMSGLMLLLTVLLVVPVLKAHAHASLTAVIMQSLLMKDNLAVIVFPLTILASLRTLPLTPLRRVYALQKMTSIERQLLANVARLCVAIAGGVATGVIISLAGTGHMTTLNTINLGLIVMGVVAVGWCGLAIWMLAVLQLTMTSLLKQVIVCVLIVASNYMVMILPATPLPVGLGGVVAAMIDAMGSTMLMNIAVYITCCGLVWGWSDWHIRRSDFG